MYLDCAGALLGKLLGLFVFAPVWEKSVKCPPPPATPSSFLRGAGPDEALIGSTRTCVLAGSRLQHLFLPSDRAVRLSVTSGRGGCAQTTC